MESMPRWFAFIALWAWHLGNLNFLGGFMKFSVENMVWGCKILAEEIKNSDLTMA